MGDFTKKCFLPSGFNFLDILRQSVKNSSQNIRYTLTYKIFNVNKCLDHDFLEVSRRTVATECVPVWWWVQFIADTCSRHIYILLNQSCRPRNMQCRPRGSTEASLHLFFTSTVVSAMPGRFIPVSIVEEAGWDPVSVWTTADKRKSLDPTGFTTPNRPARSESLGYRLLRYVKLRSGLAEDCSSEEHIQCCHLSIARKTRWTVKVSTLGCQFCWCACLVRPSWLQGAWKIGELCVTRTFAYAGWLLRLFSEQYEDIRLNDGTNSYLMWPYFYDAIFFKSEVSQERDYSVRTDCTMYYGFQSVLFSLYLCTVHTRGAWCIYASPTCQ
jgi:hypothetical protein